MQIFWEYVPAQGIFPRNHTSYEHEIFLNVFNKILWKLSKYPDPTKKTGLSST